MNPSCSNCGDVHINLYCVSPCAYLFTQSLCYTSSCAAGYVKIQIKLADGNFNRIRFLHCTLITAGIHGDGERQRYALQNISLVRYCSILKISLGIISFFFFLMFYTIPAYNAVLLHSPYNISRSHLENAKLKLSHYFNVQEQVQVQSVKRKIRWASLTATVTE